MQALYCAGMVITAPFPLAVIAVAARTQTSRFGVDIYPAPNMPIGALPTLPAGLVSIRLSVRIRGWFLTLMGAFMEGIPGGLGILLPKVTCAPAWNGCAASAGGNLPCGFRSCAR